MTNGFVAVAGVDVVKDGQLEAFEVGGTTVAVANVGGALYAFADTCTHRGCSLAEGELDGTTVICPCHGGEFDVTTGEVLGGPPPEPVRTFASRTDDGSFQIAI